MHNLYTIYTGIKYIHNKERDIHILWEICIELCTCLREKEFGMGCFRALLCIIFPPLAVLDKGCGSIILVTVLTLCGWVPGIIAALIVCKS